jgi:hypothetical protein
MNERYCCPVCGYTELDEPPYDKRGCATFSICPCCNTEFGYEDSLTEHLTLRQRWIDSGMPWRSGSSRRPADWDPMVQLKNAKMIG